jgi:hypothetical protein
MYQGLFPLPNKDGYIITLTPYNPIDGSRYEGVNALILKTILRPPDDLNPLFVTDQQLLDVNGLYHPELSYFKIKENQQPTSFASLPYLEPSRGQIENITLWHIRESSLDPEQFDNYIAQCTTSRRASYLINQTALSAEAFIRGRDRDVPNFIDTPEPAKEVFRIKSSDPEKYLGKVFAAMKLNTACLCSPEIGEEFHKNCKDYLLPSVTDKSGKTHPAPLALYQLTANAERECQKILKDLSIKNKQQALEKGSHEWTAV